MMNEMLLKWFLFVAYKIEYIMGKGQKSGYQHFALCLQFFMPPILKDWGHTVLPLSVCLSICPSSCPSVCLHKLNMKTEHFPITPKLI